MPGTGILKTGKYAKNLSGFLNKGRKVATKFKSAANTVKTVGKKVGKKVVNKASRVLSKGKNLVNKKLRPKTKRALEAAKNGIEKAKSKAKGRKIKNRGAKGERALRKRYGGQSQKRFDTKLGARIVDQFADKVAHESKVGYTCKSKTVEKQILKDIELIKRRKIDESHWHFYRSPTTGKIGMSKPLQKFLDECCKKYNGKIHYTIEYKE